MHVICELNIYIIEMMLKMFWIICYMFWLIDIA